MRTAHKIRYDEAASWFAMILLVILLGKYGSEAVEWLLMKLYEFFIQRIPVRL